ncbi:hypothetical protein FPQ18DRAFT_391121 [Pyronema domesticum]|nr:hypothetical protein FPQ18DRAFT_391121 [Pyronema domesticum]
MEQLGTLGLWVYMKQETAVDDWIYAAIRIGTNFWYLKGVEHLFVDRSKTKRVLKFLEDTEVGDRTSEKEMYEREEQRDEVRRWSEETKVESESEEGGRIRDEEIMENGMDLEDVDELIERVLQEARTGGSDERG